MPRHPTKGLYLPVGCGNIAISITTSDPLPAVPLASTPQEQASLVYFAMDQSDDCLLLLDSDDDATTSDAVLVGVNGAFRRASGYADDQLIGHQVAELFPIGNDAASLMDAIRHRRSLRTELACSRAAGGTFTLGLHLMVAPARTPRHTCFVILGRDITIVRQARQMQDSIQLLLTKVFVSVDEAVAISDASGRIVMTNPHVDRLLGYKPNGLVGRNSLEIVAQGSHATLMAKRRQQIEQGGTITYHVALLRADGSQLAARVTSVVAGTDDLKKFRIVTLRADAVDAPGVRTESAGRIKLVGMEEVRTALGDRWPAAAVRAMATAEAVVKRRCGASDTYSRVDDTSFLVCFGSLSAQEASFRAAMMGREIRERLIGQGSDPEAAHVQAIAAAMQISDRDHSPEALRAALLDGLDQQLERIEREARQTMQDALTSATCELERICGRNPEQAVATLVRLPDELERKIACALSILPHQETAAFDLDGLLLGLAARQAITAMGRGDATPLLVNVGFDVFATRAATERYIALCLRIAPKVCGRLIMLLSSLPQGLPRARLLECVNRLRPFCRSVGYQAEDLGAMEPIDLTHATDPIVALPATAFARLSSDKLKVMIASLHARRAKLLIRRIRSEKDAAAFLSQGADMISIE